LQGSGDSQHFSLLAKFNFSFFHPVVDFPFSAIAAHFGGACDAFVVKKRLGRALLFACRIGIGGVRANFLFASSK
jgi:hypothetical protein